MVCRLFVPYEYSLFYISARAEEKCQLSFPQFSTIVSTDELGFSLFSFLILECQLFFFLFLSLSQNYEFSDDTPLRKYAFEIAFFFIEILSFSLLLFTRSNSMFTSPLNRKKIQCYRSSNIALLEEERVFSLKFKSKSFRSR